MGLTYDDRLELLTAVRRSALHLEVQPLYHVEMDAFDRWREGDFTPPVDEPGFARWYGLVGERVAAGARFERIRVVDEPPTEYQQFELFCGRWNIEAGEVLRSMTRSVADELGIGPGPDWWLLDERQLIVTSFDERGRAGESHLVTAPDQVAEAARIWAIALEHSTLDDPAAVG